MYHAVRETARPTCGLVYYLLTHILPICQRRVPFMCTSINLIALHTHHSAIMLHSNVQRSCLPRFHTEIGSGY